MKETVEILVCLFIIALVRWRFDIWNDLKELEAKISDLYGYIYYKELEKQREKEGKE